MLLVSGFGDQLDTVTGAIRLEITVDGDHDKAVLRVSEHAPQRLSHTHHFIWIAFDLDGLADRIDSFEETRPQIVPDKGYSGVTPHFLGDDGSSHRDTDVVNHRDVIANAFDLH